MADTAINSPGDVTPAQRIGRETEIKLELKVNGFLGMGSKGFHASQQESGGLERDRVPRVAMVTKGCYELFRVDLDRHKLLSASSSTDN